VLDAREEFMSRIYEAMKKADQEQTGAQIKELEPLPHDPLPEFKAENVSLSSSGDGATVPTTASAPVEAATLGFGDLEKRCAHPVWNPDMNLNMFSNPAFAFGAEQFRTLRSRLYQFRSNQPLRTILVTSSMAGEGKTLVASNLAQAIVRQPNCRALLIDADLRCSRLHLTLGAPAAPGLSDYLQGAADECAIIQVAQENSLCFIPAGTRVTNPSELLSNGRLTSLLNRLAPAFDWVIVDSPPYVPLADASVLADLCDGVLLVARAGSTIAEVAQRASRDLQARKTVLGVVLNAVEGVSESYKLIRKSDDQNSAKSRRTRGSGPFRITEEK
jgi:protein-tyrosine kinase